MSLTEKQVAHTRRVGRLINYAFANGVDIKVVEWNRSLDTQKAYVAKGVSKTLNSKHLDNLATDIYVVVSGNAVLMTEGSTEAEKALYLKLGVFWEVQGGRWGGRFVDDVAFQEKNGRGFDRSKDIGWDPYHFESCDA